MGGLILKKKEGTGDRATAPFIVGVGRSGTTLLRMMLDAHSQLAIPPETHFIPDAVDACRASGNDPCETFVRVLLASRHWSDFQLDADALRARIRAFKPFDMGAALRIFYQLYAQRFGKTRWGDKTPTYLSQMQLIAQLLPETSFIHLIRDGRDVALSIKDLWFGPRSVTDAAEVWVGRIRLARKQSAQLTRYMEIRYEDLVCDTEPTLRRLCEFIDLPWESQLLDYYQGAEKRLSELSRDIRDRQGDLRATAEQRVNIHAWTKRPPETSRIGRWKKEMSPADRKQFEKIARPLLAELGYLD
jgi:Sulfotransferase family